MHEEGLNLQHAAGDKPCTGDHCRLFQKTDWAFPDETFELGVYAEFHSLGARVSGL